MADPAYYPLRTQACIRCIHYYVTYDQIFPHGCRDWNIRSRLLPSQEIRQATGQDCPRFVLLPRLAKA